MPEFEIPQPIGGLSDELSFSKQVPGTTREALNVRGIDPTNGRTRIAQRSGTSRLLDGQLNGAAPVRGGLTLAYAQKRVDYGALDGAPNDPEAVWSKRLPRGMDSRAVAVDEQSNSYWIDGLSGLVKLNADKTLVWRVSVPVLSPYHFIRAIAVSDDGSVYVATSGVISEEYAGGNQAKSRIWAYSQLPDDETPEVRWTIKPPAVFTDLDDDETDGAYIEQMVLREGKLYTVQNEPERNRGYLRVYSDIETGVPTLDYQRAVPFPAHGMSVGPDGSMYVTSEENADRGTDPLSPDTTAAAVDWTPEDLPNYRRRIWGWWKADDPDGQGGTTLADGDALAVWQDVSGNSRPWVTHTSATGGPPTWFRVGSAAGLPAISFDPVAAGGAQGLQSGSNATTDSRYSATQRTAIPGYLGAQCAFFVVGRARSPTRTNGAFGQTVWHQEITPGTGVTDSQMFSINTRFDVALNGFAAYNHADMVSATGGSPTGDIVGGLVRPDATWYDRYLADFTTGGFFIFALIDRGTDVEWWINGEPCDKWSYANSAKTITTKTQLGHLVSAQTVAGAGQVPAAFEGEIFEIISLRDYEDDAGATTLITSPGYPDANYNAGSDSETERMIGYLAHRWGLSHILPRYESNFLQVKVVPNNNDTMVIGTITYTWKTVLPGGPAANNVNILIGGSIANAIINFDAAINGLGGSGYEAGAGAEPHPTVRSAKYNNTTSLPQRGATIRTVLAATTGVACTESTAGVRTAWVAAATAANASSDNTQDAMGNYPNPFYFDNGPPRLSGLATSSVAGQLNSVNRILAKFAGNNADPKWAMTGDVYGGIGWGVVAGLQEEAGTTGDGVIDVFSIGPGLTTGTVFLQKVLDLGDTFSVAPGTPPEDAWENNVGANFDNDHVRMDTDPYGNVYLPYYETSGLVAQALQVYSRLALSSLGGSVSLAAVDIGGDLDSAYAAVIDPDIPDYDGDMSTTGSPRSRAEYVYLAGANFGDKTAPVAHKIRLVSRTPNADDARATIQIAECGGAIARFDDIAVTLPTDNSEGIEAAARYVSSMSLFSKAYFTEGRGYYVYDPKENTVEDWIGDSSGKIPRGAELVFRWGGRAGVARFADDPQNWALAALNEPDNWDFFPVVGFPGQAVLGNDSRAGTSPDIINGFAAISDDLALVLGDHSIHRLTGDPASNGRFDLISDETGGAFGRAWCKSPDGILFFFGAKGGLYLMTPPYVQAQRLTLRSIEERLRSVDLAANYVEMQWNWRDEGFHVFVIPYGIEASVETHWFVDVKHGFAVWEDNIGSGPERIASTWLSDGDDPDDRRLLLGCLDGRVRQWDPTIRWDDGTRIDSYVLLGPLVPGDAGPEFRFSGLNAVLDRREAGAQFEFFATDRPEDRGTRVASGALVGGRNPTQRARMRGAMAFVRLRNAALRDRWALETVTMTAVPAGRKRVRS